MLDALTILYTHRLRGDLARMPRIYTWLESLRADDPRPLLLDLGESCTPDVWPCSATEGRAGLVVLDGMGYHAANTAQDLSAVDRQKLRGVVTMALVDERTVWRYRVPPMEDETILVSLKPQPALRLCIALEPASETSLDAGILRLAGIEGGQLGRVRLDLQGEPSLISHEVLQMPEGLAPNPGISAAVEFVEDEARLYLRKQNGGM